MIRLSQQLRDENTGVWEAMQSHRFVTDIEADHLPDTVFHRYLVFEHAFVETAILIFGHAMLKADNFTQRRWLIGVLHALATEQLTYFERSFATLGVSARRPDQELPPDVVAFDRGMLRIAETGGYLDILVAMLAAEWMYATWCSRANERPISDPELKRWVALHAEPDFRAQADWLAAQVDDAGTALDATARTRLCGLFGHVLQLEVDFHEAAYDEAWPYSSTASGSMSR